MQACIGLNLFSGPIFTTASVVFIMVKIAFIFKSLSAVHRYDFNNYSQSFIHHFTGFFGTNIMTSSQLACEHCTSIAKVMGSNPVQA